MVNVERVDSRAQLREFIDYPYRKYRNDPNWVAPLRMSQKELLDEGKNPFWQHARRELFLARRGGRTVGRIALIDDDHHNQIHGDNLVFFGFFEAEDEDVSAALYARVEERARALGRSAVRGPANPTMNDGAGFQLDAFDKPPYVMMPQSPASYPAWAEAACYGKVKDLYAFHMPNPGQVPERLQRIVERARQRYQPVVRSADLKNFHEEVKLLQQIHTAAWQANWGQVPYTDAEIAHLASELKMIVNPDMALFLEYQGQPVAVCIAIPDLNQVLARFDGRLFPTGIFHLLRLKRIVDRVRLVMLGVLPEHRNRGFDLVLIDEVMRRGKQHGIKEGELGWTLEDNKAINNAIVASGGRHYKTYRMVQKDL